MSEEFRLKNINEITNYFLKEIQQNELISKKHKKVCTNSKLHWTSSYISFDNYCMYFNFCFCLFVCYSYMNYEFYNRIKKTCAIAAGSKTRKWEIWENLFWENIWIFFRAKFFSFSVLYYWLYICRTLGEKQNHG